MPRKHSSTCRKCTVPCRNDSFTLQVIDQDLSAGTATVQVLKNDGPFANECVGVSTVTIPLEGPIEVRTKCRERKTDKDGQIEVKFAPGGQNQVRINVNLECPQIRLSVVLTPPELLSVSALNFLALAEDEWDELKLFVAIVRANRLIIDANAHDVAQPPQQMGPCRNARAFAIAHIAVADAFNSIKRKFTRYTSIPNQPRDASVIAAIAQAAHDTLITLYSDQTPAFDAYLASELAQVPNGSSKQQGIAAGALAAQLIIADRTNDGSQIPEVFDAPALPSLYQWSQAPPESNAGGALALGRFWGLVKPFTFPSSIIPSTFRAPPPPPIGSKEYECAFNDQKALGAVGDATNPSSRVADQTQVGVYWGFDGRPGLGTPPRLYNQIAVHIATQEQLAPHELLRALVTFNVAQADAGIVCWETKYFYKVWRPITGVRFPGQPNAGVVSQADWLCLGAPASNPPAPPGTNFTPPFPSYGSGHSAFGATLFETLRRILGTDEIPFEFVSEEYNGKTTDAQGVVRPFLPRSFMRLSQAEQENGESRMYLGIHWCFDRDASIAQGDKVGAWVCERFFLPIAN